MDFDRASNYIQLGWRTVIHVFASILLYIKNHKIIWSLGVFTPLYHSFFSAPATLKIFLVLFLFRYLRLAVSLVAFCSYNPVTTFVAPKLNSTDVTVIVPTVEPYGKDFEECIETIIANGPARIIVVTAGRGIYDKAVKTMRNYSDILIKDCRFQNKREQICVALPEVATKITVLCDDHVFWSKNFLRSILASFEDEQVGCVGTQKRVRRTTGFWNLLGCLYLERHNFDSTATNIIDGGVSVVSGRTSAHRLEILQSQAFMHSFVNEYLFFGLIGPLNADDDKFITRWMVNHGWKIKIDTSKDTCIVTTLGSYPKFLHQCLRWTRTTWRSNPRSLLSARTWKTQPWCIYAVHLTSLVNFALFYDAALLYTLWISLSEPGITDAVRPRTGLSSLALWILASKLVKPFPHFRRYPTDLWYLPGTILFGYFHSLIKLYALLTFWQIAWGSRALNEGMEGGMEAEVVGMQGDKPRENGIKEGLSAVVMDGERGD